MLQLTPQQVNLVVLRQQELDRIADSWYDAYYNKISLVEWRQKWIWDYLGL